MSADGRNYREGVFLFHERSPRNTVRELSTNKEKISLKEREEIERQEENESVKNREYNLKKKHN
jgi:hypothetical protein